MNKSRWTEAEINILKSNVEKNFGNLSKAFKLTSQKTGRSYDAVQNYWYRNRDTDKLGTTFFACSVKKVVTNRKNTNTGNNLISVGIKDSIIKNIISKIKVFFNIWIKNNL